MGLLINIKQDNKQIGAICFDGKVTTLESILEIKTIIDYYNMSARNLDGIALMASISINPEAEYDGLCDDSADAAMFKFSYKRNSNKTLGYRGFGLIAATTNDINAMKEASKTLADNEASIDFTKKEISFYNFFKTTPDQLAWLKTSTGSVPSIKDVGFDPNKINFTDIEDVYGDLSDICISDTALFKTEAIPGEVFEIIQ